MGRSGAVREIRQAEGFRLRIDVYRTISPSASHDNRRGEDGARDALVGQDGSTVDEELILDDDVVSEDRDVLEADPPPDGRVPADNRRVDPRMVFDARPFHDNAAL